MEPEKNRVIHELESLLLKSNYIPIEANIVDFAVDDMLFEQNRLKKNTLNMVKKDEFFEVYVESIRANVYYLVDFGVRLQDDSSKEVRAMKPILESIDTTISPMVDSYGHERPYAPKHEVAGFSVRVDKLPDTTKRVAAINEVITKAHDYFSKIGIASKES